MRNVLFLALVEPLEVCVQVHALAGAVVSGAEDIGVFWNLPAIFPEAVQEEILIGQTALTLQAVFQLLKYI